MAYYTYTCEKLADRTSKIILERQHMTGDLVLCQPVMFENGAAAETDVSTCCIHLSNRRHKCSYMNEV